MRWTAVPIVLKPQLKVDGDRPVSAPLLNGTGNGTPAPEDGANYRVMIVQGL